MKVEDVSIRVAPREYQPLVPDKCQARGFYSIWRIRHYIRIAFGREQYELA
jgi:hypothetical protein